ERSWLGRLMRGDSNVDTMKMGDVYLCADKLGLPLRIDCPSPDSVEESVLKAIVSKMREQRRTGRLAPWPDHGEKAEAQAIRHQAQKVGYIDDPPAREPDQWQRWLRSQLGLGDPEGPGAEKRHSVLKAVGLGDWLLAQQYLPQF